MRKCLFYKKLLIQSYEANTLLCIPNTSSIMVNFRLSNTPLCRGSASTVFIGQDSETNLFAVKVQSTKGRRLPFKWNLSRVKSKEAILNELKILRRCDNFFIQTYYTCYRDRAKYYLVTELCAESIDRLVKNSTTELMFACPADVILHVLAPICQAVEYLHSMDIVHRDIKPANIMLTYEGVPKLIDFGDSKVVDASEKRLKVIDTVDLLLTFCFMSKGKKQFFLEFIPQVKRCLHQKEVKADISFPMLCQTTSEVTLISFIESMLHKMLQGELYIHHLLSFSGIVTRLRHWNQRDSILFQINHSCFLRYAKMRNISLLDIL